MAGNLRFVKYKYKSWIRTNIKLRINLAKKFSADIKISHLKIQPLQIPNRKKTGTWLPTLNFKKKDKKHITQLVS